MNGSANLLALIFMNIFLVLMISYCLWIYSPTSAVKYLMFHYVVCNVVLGLVEGCYCIILLCVA